MAGTQSRIMESFLCYGARPILKPATDIQLPILGVADPRMDENRLLQCCRQLANLLSPRKRGLTRRFYQKTLFPSALFNLLHKRNLVSFLA
jgi:hypothetical protein